MDKETEKLVEELHKKVADLEKRVSDKEIAITALTGELIKKNMDPNYLVAA
jgi:hypothetical protein